MASRKKSDRPSGSDEQSAIPEGSRTGLDDEPGVERRPGSDEVDGPLEPEAGQDEGSHITGDESVGETLDPGASTPVEQVDHALIRTDPAEESGPAGPDGGEPGSESESGPGSESESGPRGRGDALEPPPWFTDEPDPAAALPPRVRQAPVPVERVQPARRRIGSTSIGIAVLAVLALVCAGLVVAVAVKTNNDAEVAAREAAAYTPPPLSSATPAPTGPVVAVIGDETALRAADGVDAAARWPQVLEGDLGGRVVTSAAAGAGYATDGSSGTTFAEVAETVSAGSQVVVFVGGAADDRVSTLSLARSATEAISAAAEQAPDASIVVVGPLYRPADVSSATMSALRTTLQSAANLAGVRWVDPIRAGWLEGVDDTDGLTAAAERTIASRMRAVVEAAVAD